MLIIQFIILINKPLTLRTFNDYPPPDKVTPHVRSHPGTATVVVSVSTCYMYFVVTHYNKNRKTMLWKHFISN